MNGGVYVNLEKVLEMVVKNPKLKTIEYFDVTTHEPIMIAKNDEKNYELKTIREINGVVIMGVKRCN
jgi:hypothetical protein